MASPTQLPSSISRYEVQEWLGSSDMSVVYKCFDPLLNRFAAVKVPKISMPASQREVTEVRVRFESEARTLGTLFPHDNLPVLFEYHAGELGSTVDPPWYAMELVPGKSLQKIIAEGPVPLERALPWITQTARALDHVHAKRIVHRDIKPGNILVQADGRVKLIDFGIARVGFQNLTQTGVAVGTPSYMSPEQLDGKVAYEPSDQYSLGVVVYELLTGRKAFEGPNRSNVESRILRGEFAAASNVNPNVPAWADAVIGKSMRTVPTERYGSCGEFASALASPPVAATTKSDLERFGIETWVDPKTNLRWTARDNGQWVSQKEANDYCQRLNAKCGGGWRLPTIVELYGLDELGAPKNARGVALSKPWVWSSSEARGFNFVFGKASSYYGYDNITAALCVRRAGE